MTFVVLASSRVQALRHMHACIDEWPFSCHPIDASVDGQVDIRLTDVSTPLTGIRQQPVFFVYSVPHLVRVHEAALPVVLAVRVLCVMCVCAHHRMSQGSWSFTTASNHQTSNRLQCVRVHHRMR